MAAYPVTVLELWWFSLQAISPELVWGLFTRGLGLIYVISFISLTPQVLTSAGKHGGLPVALRLAGIRRDIPAPQRFFYYPTLLWFNSSHAALLALPMIGLVAAGVVVYGGPLSPYALLVCYVCYLSLDMPMGLIFPWDCVMFESTVLALFLPATLPLPELAAIAAPAPAITWAYRIALFRLMFGFGKQKFFGSRSQDSIYMRGFLSSQPLPNIFGWYAQKLPAPILRLLLYVMFVIEIPVPFLFLVPGDWSIVAGILTMLLMVGIVSFGSFGYFSPLTMVVCLTLFDNTTPAQFSFATFLDPSGPLVPNLFVALHTLGALIVFPFNSWVGQSWSQWTIWLRLPFRGLSWPVDLFRFLHPFRLVHPYGVFPPTAFPAEKGAITVDLSWDKEEWHECDFRFFACKEHDKPVFVAPHHPRGDQAVIYETYGLGPTSMISAVAGPFDPYPYGIPPGAELLAQHIVEGNGPRFVGSDELAKHDEPPQWVRMRTVMLQPASIEEARTEGKYWRRKFIGPHMADRKRDPEFWNNFMPEPELWHPEAAIWRRRSKLNKLMKRAERGENPSVAVIADAPDLTAADVQAFWSEFIPFVPEADRESWDTLKQHVQRLRERYDTKQLRVFQRLMGRYSAMLEARLQPFYIHQGLKPKRLPAKTYMHLWMLIQTIIAKGQDTFESVLKNPETARDHLEGLTFENGTYFSGLFRFEIMAFDAQKLRLIRTVLGPYEKNPDYSPMQLKIIGILHSLFGFFAYADLVVEHFKGSEYDGGYPEQYPNFVPQENGEVIPVDWDEPPSPRPDSVV